MTRAGIALAMRCHVNTVAARACCEPQGDVMAGRRRHTRFANAEGVLRLLADVSMQRGSAHEFVAIGNEAALPGELVTIHSADARDVRARVVDSRPVMIDGSVRHRVRLEALSVMGESE
jgi:hypothetical protein